MRWAGVIPALAALGLTLPAQVASAEPEQVRSLPWISATCDDGRYPKLAGEWAVGCSETGSVNRALHLPSGRQVELEQAARRPAVGPWGVASLAWDSVVWRLPEGVPVALSHRVPDTLLGPPAGDGERMAVAIEGAVLVLHPDGTKQRIPATPAPWYPPAVGDGWVAWVDLSNPQHQEDIQLLWLDSGAVEQVAGGPGHQRHVAASGPWLAWIEDDAVVVARPGEEGRRRFPADARSARSLSLSGELACWEQLDGGDIDLACNDGLVLERPGHQRSPSRAEGWLLFREGRQVLVGKVSQPDVAQAPR